jgi:hypothetical protein
MNVLFSCVAENRDEWYDRTINVALSIRRFAGRLSKAPVVVNFVEGVKPKYAQRLAELDVETRVVERVDPTYPYANKLRMLELHRELDFDVLVALDCDTVVVGDPTPHVIVAGIGAIGAKPADCDFLGEPQWRRFFGALDLPVPERRFWTTTFGQRTYPYFNSGVLVLPSENCGALYDLWLGYIYRLQDVFDQHADIAAYRQYTDQLALTASLVEGRFPLRALPVTMNFPTHLNVHPQHRGESGPPRIIHYHNRVDGDGFLRPTRYDDVNQAIDRFNRERSEFRARPYDGLGRFGTVARMTQSLRSRQWFHRPGPQAARKAVGRAVGKGKR